MVGAQVSMQNTKKTPNAITSQLQLRSIQCSDLCAELTQTSKVVLGKS